MTNYESFKQKAAIIGKIGVDGNKKEVQFAVPLNHLSNFFENVKYPTD